MLATIETRPITPDDLPLIAALQDRVFGPGRFTRTAYRVREQMGRHTELSKYCRLAMAGNTVAAAIRLSEITIGGRKGAALLGPLVVASEYAGRGFGSALVREAIDAARDDNLALVVLVGDEPYYGRFGFKRVPPGSIAFPGPVDPARILAVELKEGALADYQGLIAADRA